MFSPLTVKILMSIGYLIIQLLIAIFEFTGDYKFLTLAKLSVVMALALSIFY